MNLLNATATDATLGRPEPLALDPQAAGDVPVVTVPDQDPVRHYVPDFTHV